MRRVDKKKPVEQQPEEKLRAKGKPKSKPTEEQPKEQSKQKKKVYEKPEDVDQIPWKRGQKKKSVDQQTDEKQWPMGKRKPLPTEKVEKVELKPIPSKKLEEMTPTEQPELKPAKENEVVADSPTEPKETTPEVRPSKAQTTAPKFVKKLKPAMCKPNEPTILTATVEGMPFPEVKWFFNDAELHATKNFEMNIAEKMVALKIDKVMPESVGTYSCQVKNEAGVAISRTYIALGKNFFNISLNFYHISCSNYLHLIIYYAYTLNTNSLTHKQYKFSRLIESKMNKRYVHICYYSVNYCINC